MIENSVRILSTYVNVLLYFTQESFFLCVLTFYVVFIWLEHAITYYENEDFANNLMHFCPYIGHLHE